MSIHQVSSRCLTLAVNWTSGPDQIRHGWWSTSPPPGPSFWISVVAVARIRSREGSAESCRNLKRQEDAPDNHGDYREKGSRRSG
jgi:hypothetical protein